jgi:hypothetical protein
MQMKAQSDLFDSAALKVEAGITSNDETMRTSSFAEAQQAGTDIKKLVQDADGCVGELDMYKLENALTVDRPPDLPDPTDTGGFNGVPEVPPELDPPGFATPFK